MNISNIFRGETYFPSGMPPDKTWLGDLVHPHDLTDPQGKRLVGGCNNYSWLVAAGYHWHPANIAEIGVRFGYSMHCLILGATKAGVEEHLMQCIGYDNDSGVPGSLLLAEKRLREKWPHTDLITFNYGDTQKTSSLGIKNIDLFFLDALHTFEGVSNDLNLAWPCVREGGVILVDDVETDEGAHKAVRKFCWQKRLQYTVLPSQEGMAVIHKPYMQEDCKDLIRELQGDT